VVSSGQIPVGSLLSKWSSFKGFVSIISQLTSTCKSVHQCSPQRHQTVSGYDVRICGPLVHSSRTSNHHSRIAQHTQRHIVDSQPHSAIIPTPVPTTRTPSPDSSLPVPQCLLRRFISDPQSSAHRWRRLQPLHLPHQSATLRGSARGMVRPCLLQSSHPPHGIPSAWMRLESV